MAGYLWIPFLIISLSIEFSSAKFRSTILLPSESQSTAPSCPSPDSKLNYRPVIGILSHPGDGASGRLSNATIASYIAASYVKFVESGGARVIPLIFNEPAETLQYKLNLVDGVLFTGGWSKNGLYFEVVEAIFKKVLEKNDAGDHFPLLAIDLVWYISPERFQGNNGLATFFEILTTSADKANKVFVSTAQAHSYPVTALQWHPEKNAFEWGSSKIPHSEEVLDNLIYNYSPTFGGKAGKGYDEVYIFT